MWDGSTVWLLPSEALGALIQRVVADNLLDCSRYTGSSLQGLFFLCLYDAPHMPAFNARGYKGDVGQRIHT